MSSPSLRAPPSWLARLARITAVVSLVTAVTVAAVFDLNRRQALRRTVRWVEDAEVPTAPPADVRTDLVVVTWNIARGAGDQDPRTAPRPRAGELAQRCEAIGRTLAELGADVAVLSEVDFDSTFSRRMNLAALVARAGGFRWRVEQFNANVVFPFFRIRTGNAVLSRLPIVEAGPLELPQPSTVVQWGTGAVDLRSPVQREWSGVVGRLRVRGVRNSARVVIRLPDGTLFEIWPVHLDSRHAAMRDAAAARILEVLTAVERPVVLAGDFNTSPSASGGPAEGRAIDRLLATGRWRTDLSDDWAARMRSFPASNPRAAIDWILVTPPWRIEELHAVATDLSDHRPVVGRVVRVAEAGGGGARRD